MEFLPTAYWVMAIIGTVVTLILLFVGGDHDFGHGDVEVGHVEVEAHDLDHAGEGPGPISLRTILAFMGGWGWGGLIGWNTFGWGVLSAPFGLAVGLLMAMIIFRFSRFLYNQEATSTVSGADMVGHEGVVLTGIPANGTGEIRVYAGGMPLKTLARSESADPIAEGQRIIVVEELGGTLVVRPN
ncbi:MAG: NfeD family protein [Armatimonadetes bacterium]|nr:NfeD family protein [Armatimonadota bacterium]